MFTLAKPAISVLVFSPPVPAGVISYQYLWFIIFVSLFSQGSGEDWSVSCRTSEKNTDQRSVDEAPH